MDQIVAAIIDSVVPFGKEIEIGESEVDSVGVSSISYWTEDL